MTQVIKKQIPDKVLEKLNRLFLSWGVKPQDWAVATEPALQRQGYAIYDDKNPFEIDLWVKAKALPWKAGSGWMTIPPKGTKYLKQLERFVRTSGYSLHMVPSPFAGFTAKKMSKVVDYRLPGGKSVRLVTPESYIEQLVCLLTHKTTRAAFRYRAGKFAERAQMVLEQARGKKDQDVVKTCQSFLRLAAKLKNSKSHTTLQPSPSAEEGTVRGTGIGQKKVRGLARVILHARDFGKMKQGEILVTFDTNPEFLLILRKMKAIVTDNGGITCHAAIIAREFNVPAVVGTRFATEVLKNGDMVEVDASRGIVKKLH